MSINQLESYSLPTSARFPVNKVTWKVHPSRAVLLIHDMQEYFLNFYSENSTLIDKVKNNILTLRGWADRHNIPVVYTAQPNQQSPQERALLNDMWGSGLTTADDALQKITTLLAPRETDIVLEKWRYSAFMRSDLQALMQDSWQRDQLIICGVYAHIGCMATALDAFMRDIQAFLVADAVADFSEREHQMALDYVAGRCGCVVGTFDVVSDKKIHLTKNILKQKILSLIDETELDENDNLIDYGLDSIQVMTLIGEWKSVGIDLSFAQLALQPSLNNWWTLIEKNQL